MKTEISDHIGDEEGVRIISGLVRGIISTAREIFRQDPGNMTWSRTKVRDYIEERLLAELDKTRRDIRIKNATVAFTHNIVNDLNLGYYDISNLSQIEDRAKKYALGYWRRIRCLN